MIADPKNRPVTARSALTEYASHDATLLFGEFLHNALLFVYTDTAVLAYKARTQRTLAFRLLARSDHLGQRFLRLRMNSLRAETAAKAPSPGHGATRSAQVQALARSVEPYCASELDALAGLLRADEPQFDIHASSLGPLDFVQTLEDCLAAVPLNAVEQGIVFHAWAGVIGATLRSTYAKYRRVLEGRSDMAPDVEVGGP